MTRYPSFLTNIARNQNANQKKRSRAKSSKKERIGSSGFSIGVEPSTFLKSRKKAINALHYSTQQQLEKEEDRKLIAGLVLLKKVAEKARMAKIHTNCFDGSLHDDSSSYALKCKKCSDLYNDTYSIAQGSVITKLPAATCFHSSRDNLQRLKSMPDSNLKHCSLLLVKHQTKVSQPNLPVVKEDNKRFSNQSVNLSRKGNSTCLLRTTTLQSYWASEIISLCDSVSDASLEDPVD